MVSQSKNGIPKYGFSIKKWFPKIWFLNQKMVSQNMVSQSKNGFPKYGFSIISHILSRSMEADMFYKRISGLWLYFVVSIGITACSIVMDVVLVIKTAERHLIYFVATQLMSLASYCFHFVAYLFFIY